MVVLKTFVIRYIDEVLQMVSNTTQKNHNEIMKKGIIAADKRMITTYYKQWFTDELHKFVESFKARNTGVNMEIDCSSPDGIQLKAKW
jgi:biotin-(acetyl-CoA carboxylase) ligase